MEQETTTFNTNTLLNMDCLEAMKLITDASIDLIVADPPYYNVKGDFDFIWKTKKE
jgi:site-specific DNA-methyltransferase (adenine-specific)